MAIVFERGDVLGPYAPVATAHGCNLIGAMGRGFALAIRNRWPACYESYRTLCLRSKPRPQLGDVHTWSQGAEGDADRRVIFNMFTQPNVGKCASVGAIESCLVRMIDIAQRLEIQEVGMPWVGCGLGGLRRDDVSPILRRIDTSEITIRVFG